MDKLIVFTLPDFFDDELDKIIQLFDNGLPLLHLRKPSSSKEPLASLLDQIPRKYLSRVTIHDHFDLADEYPVGGVHLNSRNPNYLGNRKVRISKSCHSFEELGELSNYDYVTLSPIFDSVSKQGYHSQFSHDELLNNRQLITDKVVALGGVTYDNIGSLTRYGFGGAAMLGNVWKNFDIEQFRNCLKKNSKPITNY